MDPRATVVCVIAVTGRCVEMCSRSGSAEQETVTVTVAHGRVLNTLTKQPVARAAVTSDRGPFEMKITEQTVRSSGMSGTNRN